MRLSSFCVCMSLAVARAIGAKDGSGTHSPYVDETLPCKVYSGDFYTTLYHLRFPAPRGEHGPRGALGHPGGCLHRTDRVYPAGKLIRCKWPMAIRRLSPIFKFVS